MDDQGFWHWLNDGFVQLSKKYEGLRQELIDHRRLRLAFVDSGLDRVDLNSAVLVCAALAHGKPLCISLPDEKPRRPAYLLASALLNYWWRHHEESSAREHLILYCGTQAGIRGQLSNVSVAGLRQSFSSVFGQSDLPRGTHASPRVSQLLPWDSVLPKVVTAYAPADPSALIAEMAPQWIAVDFGDSGYVPWLEELLEEARGRRIPVVGWGTNPMSEALRDFNSVGHVVRWPFGRSYGADAAFCLTDPLEILLQPYLVTDVQPLLVVDDRAARYYRGLRQAEAALHKLRKRTFSSFTQTAIQHHWRLFREIGTLHVPLPLREAEVSRIWGLASIDEQVAACKRFQGALAGSDRRTARDLELASDALQDAIEYVRANEPPLWHGLAELAHEEAEDGCARLITFNTRAKKTLFVLALLAEFNITEADLKSLGNWVFSLSELPKQGRPCGEERVGKDRIPPDLSPKPILVSLPTVGLLPRLWPAFLGEDLQVVIPGFETARMARRVPIWSDAMSPNLRQLCEVIADLASLPMPRQIPDLSARVRLDDGRKIDISGTIGSSKDQIQGSALWAGSELEEELQWLIERAEDLDAPEEIEMGHEDGTDGLNTWVQEAVEVQFSGGWYGIFDRRDRLLHLDHTSAQCNQRYISAIRPDDTVLIIPFHRRQSLYNLVIERVHMHPSIELHLAVLRRWHDELVVGFEHWSARHGIYGGSMRVATEAFLQRLQELGSSLTSSQTVYLWLTGSTLCPLDPKDIARVAEILDLEFSKRQHERIARAASRIRGLHRGLSHRLANWLSDWSRGILDSNDREVIDEETGLTFGDVRGSFLIVRVVAVGTVRGPFLRSSLGEVTKGRKK